jgi:hypothetical protein
MRNDGETRFCVAQRCVHAWLKDGAIYAQELSVKPTARERSVVAVVLPRGQTSEICDRLYDCCEPLSHRDWSDDFSQRIFFLFQRELPCDVMLCCVMNWLSSSFQTQYQRK